VTCSTLDIQVYVSDLSGVFSVGFDLIYPADLLRYDGFTAGPLLAKGEPAVAPFFLVTGAAGSLEASMTRLFPDGGVTATGSEILVTLHFTIQASGTGIVDFDTSPASLSSEVILDDQGVRRPAVFSPGHGGGVATP
jgi:hypothetical protein